MEAIVERCCGLDVHQAVVVACVLTGAANERPRREIRTFSAMTQDLKALREWLEATGVTHVGMESTGVYWKPVYALLEGGFELIVGNAQHIKNVPGRKTDVKDAQWIADLVRHGLIRKSFVPPKELREARDLLRYRRSLVEARTNERNRVLKLLETANIKLASVASDVFGVSGLRMLNALLDGKKTIEEMSDLAKGALRKKRPALQLALDGRVDEHHRFILRKQLQRLDGYNRDVLELDAAIATKLVGYEKQIKLLRTLPGIDRLAASTFIAEVGVNMEHFPTVKHLAKWIGVCPGNNESAGKKKAATSRGGNVHLKTVLVEAANSLSRTKGTYLSSKFHRLRARKGPAKARMAIAHKIVIAAYFMLKEDKEYKDLGGAYLDQLHQERTKKALVRRLEGMGFDVSLKKAA
jgi:transposase